jgi:Tol biopolymer transport system component
MTVPRILQVNISREGQTMKTSALLVSAFLLLAGCDRQQDGVVAFQSNRDGNFEIYTMNADGSSQQRLTQHPANDIAAAWSPDGSRIAFASDRDGTWDIYTMRPDGSDLKQLTRGQGANTAPSWGNGGSTILFISTRDAVNGDVYRMTADGSATDRITADSLVKDTPVMTRDGKAVLVTLNIKGRFSIASIALGSRKVTVLTPPDHDSETPVIAPYGDEVMFATNRDGNYEIYSMTTAGASQTRLTANDVDDRMPSYTATQGEVLVAKKGGVYRVTLATKKETVLSYKGDYAPAWHTR